jgi:hypothetical protein
MIRLRRPLLALALALGACAPLPPEPTYPEITFRAEPPFEFDAAEVEVVDAYRSPLKAPNVEHESPLLPAAALKRWIADRIAAAGTGRRVRVTIEDASITETLLPINQDLKASFTTEQAARLEGSVALEVEVLDAEGSQLAMVRAKSARTRGLPEDATLRERDEVMFQLTEDLANDIDQIMSERIPAQFAAYLIR